MRPKDGKMATSKILVGIGITDPHQREYFFCPRPRRQHYVPAPAMCREHILPVGMPTYPPLLLHIAIY
jgi:hypothetical protein